VGSRVAAEESPDIAMIDSKSSRVDDHSRAIGNRKSFRIVIITRHPIEKSDRIDSKNLSENHCASFVRVISYSRLI